MSELITLGISHKTAPVQLRERLALTQPAMRGFLREVVEHPEVHEAVVISTCNRTELSLVVGDPVLAESGVLGHARPARRTSARPSSPRRSTRRATATPRASCSASAAASSR